MVPMQTSEADEIIKRFQQALFTTTQDKDNILRPLPFPPGTAPEDPRQYITRPQIEDIVTILIPKRQK
eukprot:3939174-Rhodomonas_salina.1